MFLNLRAQDKAHLKIARIRAALYRRWVPITPESSTKKPIEKKVEIYEENAGAAAATKNSLAREGRQKRKKRERGRNNGGFWVLFKGEEGRM